MQGPPWEQQYLHVILVRGQTFGTTLLNPRGPIKTVRGGGYNAPQDHARFEALGSSHGVHFVREEHHHPKVTTAASQGPVQIRVLFRVRRDQRTIRQNNLGRDQIVHR